MSQPKYSRDLLPINPRREALAQAAHALREKRQTLPTRYQIYPLDQIIQIEAEMTEIISSIETTIIEIDRIEAEQSRENNKR